jgi:hypothetical protein
VLLLATTGLALRTPGSHGNEIAHRPVAPLSSLRRNALSLLVKE